MKKRAPEDNWCERREGVEEGPGLAYRRKYAKSLAQILFRP